MPDPASNPYAAYGGQVATPSGTTTTDPYAAYGGQAATRPAAADPYAAYAATPTPPRPDEVMPTVQQATSLGGPPDTIGAGALKKMRQGAAGLVEMLDHYMTGMVPATAGVPTLPVALPQGGTVDKALQSLSTHLRQDSEPQGAIEKAGAIVPDLAMVANPELWGEAGATEAMTAGQRALAAAKNMITLEKNPGLLRMLQKTVGSAAAGAGRAALPAATLANVQSGGDPEKTATAALTAGAIGAPLEAIPTAASEVAAMVKPTVESLEGVAMPVLANQRPNASIVTKLIRPASYLPEIDAAQQAAPDEIIQNGAQRAIKNVLDQVNETRQIQGPAEATGTTPGTFKFTVDPIHPQLEAEPLTGARVAANAQELGPAAATIPERLQGAPVSDSQARLQATGSLGSTIPERVVTGETPAAPFETTDPAVAQKLLTEAERISENPNIGPRLKARVDARVSSLNDQFDQFHAAQQANPNFEPIDTQSAIDGTTDYRTAGDLMQRSVTDVYKRMNAATDGEMSTLLRQPRWKSADRMNELFEENSDQFTKPEWRAASDAYRKGFVAKDLDSLLQKRFTISKEGAADTADIGGTRRFSGSDQAGKDLDALIQDHGDDLRDMIGDQGIRSLRRMNQIVRDPEASGFLAKTLDKVAMVMRRHGGPVAGFIGHSVAPILGISPHAGALGGVAGGEAMSYVINRMASDPLIADRLAYAATHKLSSSVVAPLIATMMMKPTPPSPQQ